ncbi:magnesium transporter [Botrimarina sp.]|uniref:magnesium transporter n=1 Tax=Botrimarina sp. TaxID=2795802 RepID=UPI0032EF59E2
MSTAVEPSPESETESLEALREALAQEESNAEQIVALLGPLDSRDTARLVCELDQQSQAKLLTRLSPSEAVELLDDLPEVTAIEAIQAMPAEAAAGIVHELASDDQADLIGSMESDAAAAVLAELDEDEAERIAELASYADDTAGGLMATEVVALRDIATVATTLRRLRSRAEQLRRFDVQYAYVVAKGRRLVGVLRLRDLLIADESLRLADIMVADPLAVPAEKPLEELVAFFDDHAFIGAPVVDEQGRLLGVVSRRAVDEAAEAQATSDFRRSMGVVTEELRSMPTLRRSRMRLSWLSVNILLNVVAASVIAAYQETLSSVIALAVFLPIISDMSGCSGNQAVAVSMRELSLGLLRPTEWLRVWSKEATIGAINGLVLGGLLGIVAGVYGSNPWLGLVVGGALACNTLVAVILGGTIPLALRLARVDPALASSPILTTVTDMCGFFAALSLASLLLDKLV